MSAPAPQPAPAKKSGGWFKAIFLGVIGLGGGIAGTYATQVVNTVIKPAKPVANFSVSADGLGVACQNHATGETGWWDFGDGTSLVPFTADQTVTHTYAKPGGYTVKLTVRNFLGDENERSVPVEVRPGVKESPTPQILAFAVQSVSPVAYAPATYRVVADVANAEHCVWDYGDGRVEVTDGGKIDRMVTFDKPGTFPLQLVAHNGKQAAKQAGAVRIETPPAGSVTAVLKVIDTGAQVMRAARNESVAISMPAVKNPPPNFAKSVQARNGFTIAEATPVNAALPGVKNLKVAVAADKRSFTISGEWASAKGGGGSDVIVPVKLTEERVVPQPPAVTMVTGTIGGQGGQARCDLPLPPRVTGLAGAKREYQIEIRQPGPGGKTVVTAKGPPGGVGSVAFPWTGKVAGQGWTVIYSAQLNGEKVVVTATMGGI
jgi:hypothetical protein